MWLVNTQVSKDIFTNKHDIDRIFIYIHNKSKLFDLKFIDLILTIQNQIHLIKVVTVIF
jgi:hypothetical protein